MGQHPGPDAGPAGDPDPELPASSSPPAPNGSPGSLSSGSSSDSPGSCGTPASPSPADSTGPSTSEGSPGSTHSPASADPPGPADPPDRSATQAGPGAQTGPAEEPRERLLAGFAKAGAWDACLPGPELAAAVAAAAGPEWRCRGASGEQIIGILGRLAALESWMGAGKLGLIRALIRDDDPAFLCGSRHGDLPDVWEDALTHEIALALAASAPSADKTMRAAWELGARLPEISALLQTGVIDAPKARLVAEIFADLSDESAGRAEALIVAELAEPPAKTYAQVERIATAIALTIDPHLGERRRKAAERHNARVQMYRERSGTAALSGRDLATDQTLAAHANVCARADAYQDSGAFPLAKMDQLRAVAYLDLLNQVPAHERIAHGLLTAQTPASPDPGASAGPARPGGDDCPCAECDGSCLPADDNDPDDNDPDDNDDDGPGPGPHGNGGPDDEPGEDGPGNGRGGSADGNGTHGKGTDGNADHHGHGDDGANPGAGDWGTAGSPSPDDAEPPSGGPVHETDPAPPLRSLVGPRPVLQDLVLPLATLLGLADKPGEGHGLGPLDPDLCRTLASTAAASPHTTFCLTITKHDGIAIGHGCAKPGKIADPGPGGPAPPLVALPARINLTVTANHLAQLLSAKTGRTCGPSPPAPANQAPTGWALAPRGAPGSHVPRHPPPADPDWCGTWVLTLPGSRELTVRLEPMPTYECDHRHESHGYQPNDRLRHLVQVRDYVCTFPTCNRHARESDFEHAVPYDKGGRTCACNAGARSRKCHRVKQAPGWTVTQPRPGWHNWSTPRGRTYTQGPKRYPV